MAISARQLGSTSPPPPKIAEGEVKMLKVLGPVRLFRGQFSQGFEGFKVFMISLHLEWNLTSLQEVAPGEEGPTDIVGFFLPHSPALLCFCFFEVYAQGCSWPCSFSWSKTAPTATLLASAWMIKGFSGSRCYSTSSVEKSLFSFSNEAWHSIIHFRGWGWG